MQIIVVVLVLRKWLFVTNYRLYLEDRAPNRSGDGMAWQQFTVQENQVVPQIFTDGGARFSFAMNATKPSVLWFRANSVSPVSYEVSVVRNDSSQLLKRSHLQGEISEKIALPPLTGLLQFRSEGSITWSDLRIVQQFDPTIHLSILAILLVVTYFVHRTARHDEISRPPRPVRAFFLAATTVPALLTLGLGEMAMQNLGERLPLPVLPLRRELGIVSPDPRWQQSKRYGPRLRPHLNTFLEWQYGDIVQMTFIPPEVSPGTVSRFPFRTDSEGFRNTRTRTDIHVAALGDSFTDSMTLPEENIWTTLLEQDLGKPVQNYGTAGFGPQQELHVLEDYAIHHHPRVIVVAFFAGNDIFNAEKTDQLERSGETIQQPVPGWKIKKVVARYETFYLFALMSRAVNQLWGTGSTSANQRKPSDVSEDQTGISGSGPAFDRGMFSVPINQRTLRFALMPPYLQTLGFSREDLESRLGWKVTCATLLKMKSICEDSGARLIVMFIPFKSQVVLPLLQRSFRDADLREAFRFYFRQRPTMFDLQSMSRNRLAQNELMRHFCEESNIPLLDLTPAFQEKFESGRNLYFPDDSHWNAAGHELAAAELAKFMRERGLHQ